MQRRVRDCIHINGVVMSDISRISHTHTKSYHSQPLMKSAESSTNTCTLLYHVRNSLSSLSCHCFTITDTTVYTTYNRDVHKKGYERFRALLLNDRIMCDL